ncbi:glycosyltransferase [Candidatus Fermentibacteria bacterium]|nr:glycosyltransferase [Candidatus Fermentibacteria bacterium]
MNGPCGSAILARRAVSIDRESPGYTATAPRVGFVLARYPVLSETFILRELYEMHRLGIQVSIFAFGSNPDNLAHPMVQALDAPVVILPEERRRAHIARAFLFWGTHAPRTLTRALRGAGGPEAFHASLGALYLAREAIPHAPEHFHAHYLSSPAAAARTMAILHGTTFSATAHAHDIYLSDPDELGRRITQAAWVRTISRFNRRLLRGMALGISPRRVQVIRVGIDLSSYAYRPPDPQPAVCRIASVGRLVAIKGFDVLLKAVALLSARPWFLSIVGAGPLEHSLKGLATELGISHRVRFEGPLVQEAVRDLLAKTDLFVLAARRDDAGNMDGLPSVLTEALATGIPTVSTTVSGIPELVGAGAGLLVPPGDPQAMAAAMARLMDEPELRLRLSARGRRRVERAWSVQARCRDLSRRLGELSGHGLAPSPPRP